MTCAQVQTRSAQGSTNSVNVGITTTAANLLAIVSTSGSTSSTDVTAPTRTGETNNNGVADLGDAGAYSMRGDYMMNISANSNNVVCNASVGHVSGCVTEVSGALTSGALGLHNFHQVTSSTTCNVAGANFTPTAGSEIICGTASGTATTGADTIDSGFTVGETGGAATVWDGSGASAGTGSAYHDNIAASAINPLWTLPGGATAVNMGGLYMEFLAAAGGGGGNPAPLPSQRTVRGIG